MTISFEEAFTSGWSDANSAVMQPAIVSWLRRDNVNVHFIGDIGQYVHETLYYNYIYLKCELIEF